MHSDRQGSEDKRAVTVSLMPSATGQDERAYTPMETEREAWVEADDKASLHTRLLSETH